MNKQYSNRSKYFIGLLGLSLCAALQVSAQPSGGFGGGSSTRTSSTSRSSGSSSTSTRSYTSSGQIGDAYFSIDPETRRVVTIADEDTMQYISQVLSNLDRPKPQVLIKVVFLEVTYNNASDIGLEGGWAKGIGDSTSANAANVFGLGGLSSATTNMQFNSLGQPVSSFAAAAPITSQGAGLYQLMGQNYQVTLRAIATASKAKILSRPSILARNNQPATILIGQEYPTVSSISFSGVNSSIPISSITYRQVGTVLQVTPFITSDGLVEMIISPQISEVDPTTFVTISAGVTANAINTRQADTVAVTPDGQTVIIGGLIQDSKTKTDTKIPWLGDIPVLGNLFKRQTRNDVKTELIIFLTPHIVQMPSQLAALSASERQKMDQSKAFSEEELNKFLDDLPQKDHKADKAKKPANKDSNSPQDGW